MVDIHTHILPGIDDGSISMEQSMIMAEQAYRSGTTAIVASSHSNQIGRFENFEGPEFRNQYKEFVTALKQEGIPLKVARGMEIFTFDPDDTLDKIQNGMLIPLNRSSNYLIEFAFDENPWTMESIIQNILNAGYRPILAHPERYYCVQDNPNLLFEWRKIGAYAQINKGSILGRFGYECEKAADIFLSHHMADCIASDTHSHEFRTPDLKETYQLIERRYSEKYAKILLDSNPVRILMNYELLEAQPMTPYTPRKWY